MCKPGIKTKTATIWISVAITIRLECVRNMEEIVKIGGVVSTQKSCKLKNNKSKVEIKKC